MPADRYSQATAERRGVRARGARVADGRHRRPERTARPRATGPEAVDGLSSPLSAVVALLTIVTLELIRSTGPLLELAFEVGVVTAAVTAGATYLGAGLLAFILLTATRRTDVVTSLFVGVVAVTIVRVAVQATTGTARFVVGLGAIALAVAVLVLAVAVLAGRSGGAGAATAAVAFGATTGVAMQLWLGTWDAYWRHDAIGWGFTVVLLAILLIVAERTRRDPGMVPHQHTSRLWAIGIVLGLLLMVLANCGFAASQSGVRLAVAGPIAGAGLLLAGATVVLHERERSARRVLAGRAVAPVAALAPAAAIFGVFRASGAVVLVLLVMAQVSVFIALVRALGRSTDRPATPPRVAATAALGGLGAILPTLLFQLDYDIPLGFPNDLVIVAAAVVLGASTLHRPARVAVADGRPAFGRSRVLVGSAAALLVGTTFALGRDVVSEPRASDITAGDTTLTLVSWNVHYGVGPQGGLDLEQIARTIEAHQPDVVTLQEVSRGWVLGGGADMAGWLADRLDLRIAFAPAADRQFGNAVLTSLPVAATEVVDLPYGNGPQDRSAMAIDLVVPNGTLRVTSVHLQNKGHVPTRLAQIDTLLGEVTADDGLALLIAGDFNARPESEEVARMLGEGLTSAQDESGDPSALTDPSIDPDKRIDWIFGHGVVFDHTEVLADAPYSDHRALVTTFTIG